MAHEVQFTAVGVSTCCCCTGPVTGTNVFLITESQYRLYQKGGTWKLHGKIDLTESCYESDTSWGTNNGSGENTVDVDASGCDQYAYGTVSVSGTFNGPSGSSDYSNTEYMSFEAHLGKDDSGNHYIQFIANMHNVYSGDATGTGYPPTISITVSDSIASYSFTVYGAWHPSWASYSSYSNSSFDIMTATFTPAP